MGTMADSCEPLYVVLRWPKGDLYAGPFESARCFGDALTQASVIISAPRSEALRIAAFGIVRPVVPGDRALIPGTIERPHGEEDEARVERP
jgi:hypothetical protein